MPRLLTSSFLLQAVGLGIDNAAQWKDILKESAQLALVMILLDRLGFVDGEPWFEANLDTMSVQAALFHGKAVSVWESTWHFMIHTSRIELRN